MDECLVFLHIPKTAGTTLNSLMVHHYTPNNFKIGIWGNQPKHTVEELAFLSDEKKAELKLIHGHHAYGAHALIGRPCRYFTVLRNPIERVFSYYRHMHRIANKGAEHLDFTTFLSTENWFEVENGMTKRLAGVMDSDGQSVSGSDLRPVAERQCTIEHFERARARIESGEIAVGIQEYLPESLVTFHWDFGWPPAFDLGSQNAAPTPRRRLEPVEIATVKAMNEYDLALYQFAKKKFCDTLAAREPAFHQTLFLFRHFAGLIATHRRDGIPLYERMAGVIGDLVRGNQIELATTASSMLAKRYREAPVFQLLAARLQLNRRNTNKAITYLEYCLEQQPNNGDARALLEHAQRMARAAC